MIWRLIEYGAAIGSLVLAAALLAGPLWLWHRWTCPRCKLQRQIEREVRRQTGGRR